LRVSKVKTPILILSGMAGIEDKVRGLGFGADDYMTKPFHKDELVARIHAIVRRSKGHASRSSPPATWSVNLDAKTVEVGSAAGAPDRQGIPDAGAALASQGHHADQGNVPQPSVWRHGRAGTEDHRRVHLQAAQEAGSSRGGQNYIETVWGRGYVLREPENKKPAGPAGFLLSAKLVPPVREDEWIYLAPWDNLPDPVRPPLRKAQRLP
jgi:two-component system cell cycle response regulator CtrA